MKRSPEALAHNEFDLVVVGGGIFGICAAWDGALRGLSVALIERGDFGHATSANHFKVVHGGIRYLQHADLKRVRESNRERNAMLRMAPHLARPMPFVIPTYGHGLQGAEYMAMGLHVYNLLTYDRSRGIKEPGNVIPAAHMISRQECLRRFPYVEPVGLSGAAVFYDGQMVHPARLSLAVLRAAEQAGAEVLNYAEVTQFLHRDSRIYGVTVRDRLSGDSFDVLGKVVLNAAGPWASKLLHETLSVPMNPHPTFSRDAYFIVSRRLSGDYALAVQGQTHDPDALFSRGNRHLFLVPWRHYTQVGVWHKVHTGKPDEISLTEPELQAFIDEVNRAAPGLELSLDEVTRCHAGLTLFGENEPDATHLRYGKRSLLIDHTRTNGLDGLISMVGVRYTTARGVAEDAIDLVFAKLGKRAPRCRTAETPAYGGNFESMESLLGEVRATCPSGWGLDTMMALVRNYGAAYGEVLAYVQEQPELGETIGWSTVTKAEVVHAVREEMAQTLADVVLRRTDLGGGEDPGEEALRVAAGLMAQELKWDEQRVAQEIASVRSVYAKEYQRCKPMATVPTMEHTPLTGQMETAQAVPAAPERVMATSR